MRLNSKQTSWKRARLHRPLVRGRMSPSRCCWNTRKRTPAFERISPQWVRQQQRHRSDRQGQEGRGGLSHPFASHSPPSSPFLCVCLCMSDWFFARANMHRVRRLFRAKNARYGWKGQIKNMFLAVQGWMVLMLVGVCTAVSAVSERKRGGDNRRRRVAGGTISRGIKVASFPSSPLCA